MELNECKNRLDDFLKRNPLSSVDELKISGKKQFAVVQPWGDDSLIITLDDEEEIFEVLNAIYFPERFSALWHADSQALEFIWAALPVRSEVKGRKFSFSFENEDYDCHFGPSRQRLIALAKNAKPVKNSKTDHRNLISFFFFNDKDIAGQAPFEPHSFWVKPVKWDEDGVLGLAHHLNFYMSYFDIGTPRIMLHTTKIEEMAVKPRTRYIDGKFPERVEGRRLDDNLLDFWDASLSGDPARKFIYCYRIIEYASFSYVDARTRSLVRRILASPTFSHRVDETAEKIVSAISSNRLDEVPRINTFLEEAVDPELIWNEINQNLGAFSSETCFDGGFKVPPLLHGNDKRGAFFTAWPTAVHGALRNIRNALSHGRDQKTASVITPTTANFNRLRPWLAITSIAAGQVVVYQGTI
ncbi:MAG: hypothetical protein ACLPWS_02330 [Rhodomicrobium sp.]